MSRRDLGYALVVAAAAAVVLVLSPDNQLLPSLAAVVACFLIVAVWLTAVRRLTARGTIDRLANSRWMYLTVPAWAVLGGAGTLFVTRDLLDLGSGIQIAAWIVGLVGGGVVRLVELGQRGARVSGSTPGPDAPPPPRVAPGSGAR